MTSVLTQPHKISWYFVEFTYGAVGNPASYLLTNWSTDLPGPGGLYTSCPSLSIKLPKNSGTLQEQVAQIVTPLDAGNFPDLASRGEPFAPIFVSIWEYTSPLPGEPFNGAQYLVYRGRISRTVRNYQGRHEAVLFEATNDKGRMRVPLGLMVVHHCPWNFCGTGCNIDQSTLIETGTVVSINQRTVVLSGVPARISTTDRYYHRGQLTRNGLVLDIFDWDPTVQNTFIMYRQPPASWLSQTVDVIPGCDKTNQTCSARWSNIQFFGGVGFSIPAYNPLFDQA